LSEEIFQRIQPLQPEGCELFERRADLRERARVQVKTVVLAGTHALQDAGALLAAVPVDRYSYARSPDGYRLWRIRP